MTDFLTHFHLIRPWFLLLLPVVAAILWLRYQQQRSSVELSAHCDPHLLEAIVDHADGKATATSHNTALVTSIALFCLFGIFAIGLAGPSWEKKPIPLVEPQNARVVVLGLAQSMNNTDLAPSRFARAKFKTADLIQSAPAILQALVIYSGDAFVVSPLSDDHNTILNLLKAVEMDTLPTAGNRTDRGLETAAQLLDQPSLGYKEIVLITDTASPLSLQTAQQLAAKNIHVSVISVNVEDSANSSLLQAIAKTGAGIYSHLVAGKTDVNALNTFLQRRAALNFSKQQSAATQFGAEEYQDQGAWLLALILAFASLLFRKGWLLSMGLVCVILTPQTSYALNWQDLWQRQDQQAAKQFKQGQFDSALAAQSDQSKPWQGAAAYRKQDYQVAAELLEGLEDATSAYNLGNTYAQQGQYEQAIAAYDTSLSLDPASSDAKHNKDIIEKLLEQQSQQDQQSEQQDESGEESQQGDQAEQQSDDSQSGEQDNSQDSNAESEQQETDANNAEKSEQQDEDAETDEQAGEENETQSAEQSEAQDQQQVESIAQALQSEEQQALEQWLRKLPDNPGALLKRKFKVQHQQRQQQATQ